MWTNVDFSSVKSCDIHRGPFHWKCLRYNHSNKWEKYIFQITTYFWWQWAKHILHVVSLSLGNHRIHDDIIKWKHFLLYWPFVRGIHQSPLNSPHKGQWRGALMFFLICTWINGWVNNPESGDLKRHRTPLWHHCDGLSYSGIAMKSMDNCIARSQRNWW